MAFNSVLAMGLSGRSFLLVLASGDTEYVVENNLVTTYPTSGGSKAGDIITLSIPPGVVRGASNTSSYAINGDTLHNGARLIIIVGITATITGHGGAGGAGGIYTAGSPESGAPGSPGENGGTAVKLGCYTTISGSGTVTKGYGGGGGGGPDTTLNRGGCGGGGGAGSYPSVAGAGQSPAEWGGFGTLTTGGAGGTTNGFDGGKGGDIGSPAVAGQNGTNVGGAAGTDGKAIELNGFTGSFTATIVGDIS